MKTNPQTDELTGTWKGKCPKCKATYNQFVGPSPCCGAPTEPVDHDPAGKAPVVVKRTKTAAEASHE